MTDSYNYILSNPPLNQPLLRGRKNAAHTRPASRVTAATGTWETDAGGGVTGHVLRPAPPLRGALVRAAAAVKDTVGRNWGAGYASRAPPRPSKAPRDTSSWFAQQQLGGRGSLVTCSAPPRPSEAPHSPDSLVRAAAASGGRGGRAPEAERELENGSIAFSSRTIGQPGGRGGLSAPAASGRVAGRSSGGHFGWLGSSKLFPRSWERFYDASTVEPRPPPARLSWVCPVNERAVPARGHLG